MTPKIHFLLTFISLLYNLKSILYGRQIQKRSKELNQSVGGIIDNKAIGEKDHATTLIVTPTHFQYLCQFRYTNYQPSLYFTSGTLDETIRETGTIKRSQ